jgi:hypothetical protein
MWRHDPDKRARSHARTHYGKAHHHCAPIREPSVEITSEELTDRSGQQWLRAMVLEACTVHTRPDEYITGCTKIPFWNRRSLSTPPTLKYHLTGNTAPQCSKCKVVHGIGALLVMPITITLADPQYAQYPVCQLRDRAGDKCRVVESQQRLLINDPTVCAQPEPVATLREVETGCCLW